MFLLDASFIYLSPVLTTKPLSPTTHIDPENVELEQPKRQGSDINTTGFERGDVGTAHFLCVNKYCDAKPHLMLLTSDGCERQHEAMDETDVKAVWKLLTFLGDDDGAFYNCGKDGRRSRMHKSLQLMPTPRDTLATILDRQDGTQPHVPFR
ncbi:hypothetical protein QQS21_001705 [Conoideocrella luteorostrata]|uniref:Ap4A phosphorylase 1/2 N-terminal domain-containing protein n=1 Tax=Conoideocrella luteorostrata TaxID=1105319 RepID=A0AAJ0CWI2_9HYPO|nr:hypothetical protein QQS21_001705 [Conoideocrella luteorostrata]